MEQYFLKDVNGTGRASALLRYVVPSCYLEFSN